MLRNGGPPLDKKVSVDPSRRAPYPGDFDTLREDWTSGSAFDMTTCVIMAVLLLKEMSLQTLFEMPRAQVQ